MYGDLVCRLINVCTCVSPSILNLLQSLFHFAKSSCAECIYIGELIAVYSTAPQNNPISSFPKICQDAPITLHQNSFFWEEVQADRSHRSCRFWQGLQGWLASKNNKAPSNHVIIRANLFALPSCLWTERTQDPEFLCELLVNRLLSSLWYWIDSEIHISIIILTDLLPGKDSHARLETIKGSR